MYSCPVTRVDPVIDECLRLAYATPTGLSDDERERGATAALPFNPFLGVASRVDATWFVRS